MDAKSVFTLKVLKTAQKQVHQKHEYGNTYEVLAYLVPSFQTSVTRLPASLTN